MRYIRVTTAETLYRSYLVAIDEEQDECDASEAVLNGEVDFFHDEFGVDGEEVIETEEVLESELLDTMKNTERDGWTLNTIKELTPVAQSS